MESISKRYNRIRPHLNAILRGIRAHIAGKPTPQEAHSALIALHCETQGRSTQLISSVLSFHRPFRCREKTSDIFGAFDEDLIRPIVEAIRLDGFAILPSKLPIHHIERLVDFAKTTTATLSAGPNPGRAIYDAKQPKAPIYQFMVDQTYPNEDVQNVMADPLLLSIAGRYLGVIPIIDGLSMWWSAVYEDGDIGEAAQLFHFDMDRPRWLKLFVYLTDVDENSGPHVYVRQSHRLRSDKIGQLLRRGYARIPDSDIIDAYGTDAIHHICAPAGTIFVADTIGFHKGLPPTKNPRLVLELSYATTLFGAGLTYGGCPAQMTSAMRAARKTWPETFTLFEG